jgi:hypothetical protein
MAEIQLPAQVVAEKIVFNSMEIKTLTFDLKGNSLKELPRII